ncbi:MAG TPA: 3-oxoacyl-[acyl-carrier-protein] synthase III C-terminal domain-containing protein [Rubrobacteraceae bacterium]|nr:3-oxoacyl-[acyl-carrier-protein] synthase III C-terminal domain-containing protein [Rubrobacteraceae bacterium]
MSDVAPKILSVATALPPYRIGQGEVKEFARGMFSGAHGDFERLLRIFDNTNIDGRHFCVPPAWFERDRSFTEKNALYVEHALDLSEKAARRALDRAGAEPGDVGAIFFVSTTGLSTPSLDSKLIFRLGLSEHTRRVPIWGLGCAAGVAGLARTADHARLYPGELALLVGVELCGLTFQRGDLSKANLVSTSLFADGAAAAVLGSGAEGPELIGSHSTTWPDTEDIMGWDLVETGFKVRISRSIPALVRQRMSENLLAACASVDLSPEDIEHFLNHPGGSRVLDALEEVLGLEPGGLALPREVLRECGNMSSVTVMFVLERFLKSGEFKAGDIGVLSALGPGFSAEHVFFRC